MHLFLPSFLANTNVCVRDGVYIHVCVYFLFVCMNMIVRIFVSWCVCTSVRVHALPPATGPWQVIWIHICFLWRLSPNQSWSQHDYVWLALVFAGDEDFDLNLKACYQLKKHFPYSPRVQCMMSKPDKSYCVFDEIQVVWKRRQTQTYEVNICRHTAYCIWSVFSSFSNLNR